MALRRSSTLSRRKSAPAGGTSTTPSDKCLVCGTPGLRRRTITSKADPSLVKDVNVCPGCGFVAIDELPIVRYRDAKTISDLPGGGNRIGTPDRPGREFQMGKMAVDILGRDGLDVMVYGAGRSFDNHHLAALDQVHEAAIGDIMKVRDDAPFHDTNLPATRTFDVVVASEVVEHFRNPRADFARLFEFVAPDGILVCGTSIKDGKGLSGHRYVFYPDHTSYYTPRSLQIIARENGFKIDFRSPQGSGVRKRYVLFTRSPEIQEEIALYFGTRSFAPSESNPA